MPAASNPEQAAPSSAADRLASVRAALDATTRKISELDQARNERLLADDNEGAIKLGIEIASLRLSARADVDKIALLREKAAEEERARRAQERQALIERIEKKIAQRDAAMEGVAAAIKQLASASERAIILGREIIDAWSWPNHDLVPALLTPSSIMTAIAHECFRTSHHPRRFGGADTDPLAGISLPLSRAPTLQLLEDPSRVRSMEDVVGEASAFARRFLKTGVGSAGVQATDTNVSVPTNGQAERKMAESGDPKFVRAHTIEDAIGAPSAPQHTDAERRRGELWRRLDDPALDDDPTLKAEVVAALAQVEDEIAAAKQVERQHG
jgi:hypothetical protein